MKLERTARSASNRQWQTTLGLFALLPVLLGATPAIRFQGATNGGYLTLMPVEVTVEFDANADAGTLLVLLNGNDISASFSLETPVGGRRKATAVDVWEGFVQLGLNTLTASIDLGAGSVMTTANFHTVGDPYADEVVSYVPGTSGGFNSGALPGIVLGPPVGTGLFLGSLDVLSLGFGGSIVLGFTDNVIVDRAGVDFTVFENAILRMADLMTDLPFAEPARVGVSQDGVDWVYFSCTLTIAAMPYWPGCAGVYPVVSNGTSAKPHASIPTSVPIEDLVGVSILTIQNPPGSGGDSFDLADVGLDWARYVRIEAASFATGPFGVDNAAFDLDAVAVVNSAPSIPSLPALSLPGLAALAASLLSASTLMLRRRSQG